MNIRIYTLVSIAVATAFAGCRSTVVVSAGKPSSVCVRSVQYVPAVGLSDDTTVEVLLQNDGRDSIVISRVELDGLGLTEIRASRFRGLKAFRFGGVFGGKRGKPEAGSAARWWRIYPSSELAPGGFAVLQINFAGSSFPHEVRLSLSDGHDLMVRVPRYSSPVRRIEHLSFPDDGKSVHVRYSKGPAPEKVLVNGLKCPSAKVLETGDAGAPGAVVVPLAQSVRDGDPILLELQFPRGVKCFAFVRAFVGLCFVAPDGRRDDRPLAKDERQRYGFDSDMKFYRVPIDVACEDVRAHAPGTSAKDVVSEIRNYLDRNPSGLTAVDVCTAQYPTVWNIYSQVADAVVVKPYRLHWGADASRFEEEEISFVRAKAVDVSPRPIIWVPERFSRGGGICGEAFETMAWAVLMNGARGMRIHNWMNGNADPFAGNPGMGEAIVRFSEFLQTNRSDFASLIPMRTIERRDPRLTVHEGWVGDRAVILQVRNLLYDNGLSSRKGTERGDRVVMVRKDVDVKYPVPKWMRPTRAIDMATGRPLELHVNNGVAEIRLPVLSEYSLVKILNEN